ncbi:MAG: sortase [Candidatus Gracilibacteria bacterium]|nr:sortase [Candidatus Gracilibacteria bacterium]
MIKKILTFLTIYFILATNLVFAGASGDSSSIQTRLPSYVGELSGVFVDDINYWKSGLPSEDQNKNEYIVIPSNGLIVPINRIPENTNDYTSMLQYKSIDINKYLQTGVLLYPKKSPSSYGEYGNNTIFGHSSYFKSDLGRYKTQFQLIIGLEVGKEVWVYKKNNLGLWKRYRYKVTKSYETTPNDVSILKTRYVKELTLFTCTPIGNITGRWVVKAEYIEEPNYTLSPKIKLFGNKLVKTVSNIQNKELKNQAILKINSNINKLLKSNPSNTRLIEITDYFKNRLGVEYLL